MLLHLSGELFRMMAGIEVVHVPYRGTPAAHSALIAGDVHAMFDAVGSSLPLEFCYRGGPMGSWRAVPESLLLEKSMSWTCRLNS